MSDYDQTTIQMAAYRAIQKDLNHLREQTEKTFNFGIKMIDDINRATELMRAALERMDELEKRIEALENANP